VVDRRGLATEHRVGEGVALADRDGGEIDRSVTSPTAKMLGTEVREYSSTSIPPVFPSERQALKPKALDVGAAGRSQTSPDSTMISCARTVRRKGPWSTVSMPSDDLLGDDPDAALLHLGMQVRAQVIVETRRMLSPRRPSVTCEPSPLKMPANSTAI